MSVKSTPPPITVGKINILPTSNELVLNGNPGINRRIDDLLMRVLLKLINHSNEVVNREVFIDQLWDGNTDVGEKGLTKSISRLRKILQGIDPEITIETIPKKGYRLNAKNVDQNSPTGKFNKKNPFKWEIRLALIALILLILFLMHYLNH